jgi:adenylate cyclase
LAELAHHFDRSGNAPKAVECLARTASKAAGQGAHSEAIDYFTRALELLPQLPEGAARDRQELNLQMGLSWSVFMALGPRAPERQSTLVRARELCERLGEEVRLMQVLVALGHERLSWNDFRPARELAERVIAMAQQTEAPAVLLGAHNALGIVRFAAGQFPAAREHFERAAELSGAGPSDDYGTYFAQNAPNILMAVLVILGYPSTALSRADKLLAAARRGSDPNSIAIHLFSYCMHHFLLRDTRMVAEHANELLSLAIEHEMRTNHLHATFFRGWTSAIAGRYEEGIDEMRQSLSDRMAEGLASSALMLLGLAETCGQHGHVEEGLEWVAKGLVRTEQTGLRLTEAELYRLKGDLLIVKDQGNAAAAERSLRTAIDVARQQSARLFELHATVSLARVLRDTNRCDEGRAMLAEVYDWFTEGFDTVDLKDAKLLLDELSAK